MDSRIGLTMLFWQKRIIQPTSSWPSITLTIVTLSSLISFHTRLGESSVLTEMEKPGKMINNISLQFMLLLIYSVQRILTLQFSTISIEYLSYFLHLYNLIVLGTWNNTIKRIRYYYCDSFIFYSLIRSCKLCFIFPSYFRKILHKHGPFRNTFILGKKLQNL